MGAFAERPMCYKVGVFLLLLATSIFTLSMSVPWWAQTFNRETRQITRHSGLWMGCMSENGTAKSECSPIIAPDWFKAVQSLQCIALTLMFLSCGYALFTNCCLRQVIYSRTVEILAGIGGIVGFLGCMIYITKTSPILKMNREISYSWAFGADLASCIFVLIISGVIGVSNTRDDEEDRSMFLEEIHTEDCTRWHRGRLAGVSSQDVRTESASSPSSTATPRRSPAPTRSTGPNTEVFVVQNNYPYPEKGQLCHATHHNSQSEPHKGREKTGREGCARTEHMLPRSHHHLSQIGLSDGRVKRDCTGRSETGCGNADYNERLNTKFSECQCISRGIDRQGCRGNWDPDVNFDSNAGDSKINNPNMDHGSTKINGSKMADPNMDHDSKMNISYMASLNANYDDPNINNSKMADASMDRDDTKMNSSKMVSPNGNGRKVISSEMNNLKIHHSEAPLNSNAYSSKPTNISASATERTVLPQTYIPQNINNTSHCRCACACQSRNIKPCEARPDFGRQDNEMGGDQLSERLKASAPPPEHSHTDFTTAQFMAQSETVTLPRRL